MATPPDETKKKPPFAAAKRAEEEVAELRKRVSELEGELKKRAEEEEESPEEEEEEEKKKKKAEVEAAVAKANAERLARIKARRENPGQPATQNAAPQAPVQVPIRAGIPVPTGMNPAEFYAILDGATGELYNGCIEGRIPGAQLAEADVPPEIRAHVDGARRFRAQREHGQKPRLN